ncbi:MAG: polyphosphate kinase 1 [Clostridium sp.]
MSDKKFQYTQNRELSWLKFNERVLEEAEDKEVPLLERLLFVSIFISNLDEFFMVRVGSLFDLSILHKNKIDKRSGMTPGEQLNRIYEEMKPLYRKKEKIYYEIENNLKSYGISSVSMNELNNTERDYVKQYFKHQILPILSPQIIDTHHPFPHLINKVINIVTILKSKGKSVFGIIPVPSTVPDIIFLPDSREIKYINTEKIILEYVDEVFDMYNVIEKNYICVTRNADIDITTEDDDSFDIDEDFRYMMKKILSKRERLAVVRLEVGQELSRKFEDFFCKKFKINKKQIFYTKSPMKIDYIQAIKNKISLALKMKLSYPSFSPQKSNQLLLDQSIMEQVKQNDILLSYPFESMKPFLQIVKEAANDPAVVSIKICIYRLAKKARLVEYLCEAAENGKDVTVIIELRARFDEKNNIDWSEILEEAGCRVIYGFEEFKVHSKICLITKMEKNQITYFTHISTGNFNEKTAELYTDLSLLTSNKMIGRDAVNFFKNMAIANLNGSYNLLLVSPFELKSKIISLIRQEADKKEKGRIIIKINSITDIEIIEELSKASCSGVKIDLIVRGICCIVPGIKGYTENIKVTSIVGRFLEHSRIYSFGNGEDQKIYISSADFMTRNTEKRVEVACPILDDKLKARINDMIEIILKDNVKARELKSNGEYTKKAIIGEKINSQENFITESLKNSEIFTVLIQKEEKVQYI